MNENIEVNYYAVIPAPIRYDVRLTANEKLLYGELTSLANKYGYCYAQNKYFAYLYKVSNRSVSRWISHLGKFGYIVVELIRDGNKEIKERKIYIRDGPNLLRQNCLYPNDKIVVENIIDNKMIDRFYLCIIENKRDKNFDKEKIKKVLEHFDFLYTKELLDNFTEENKEKIKIIMFSIYLLSEKTSLYFIEKLTREKIIFIYDKCYAKKNEIINFTSYFIAALENEIVRF